MKTDKKRKKTRKRNNPHGANQHVPDPRQSKFLSLFMDPTSKTFSNALQSALSAGFSQEYAESITAQMPKWLSESLGENDMLSRAERNLSDILDLNPIVQAMGAFGPIFEKKTTGKGKKKRVTKKPVLVVNTKLLTIKTDTSKFIAERLGRKKYGQKGANVVVPIQVNINEDRQEYA